MICLFALDMGLAQTGDDLMLQPTHVVGKRINAAGETTATLEADFTYNEDGKVYRFLFPQFTLTSSFFYTGDYLYQEGVTHGAVPPGEGPGYDLMESNNYTYYEDGKLKHHKHHWSYYFTDEDWEYTYDEYGYLKQIDYKEYDEYHQHYIYEYENEDKTQIESYWTSWVSEGMKLRKKTIKQFDDEFHLITVNTQQYSLEGDTTSNTMVTYTYAPSGEEESQITQTLTEGEWANTSIQLYFYDEDGRVVERQNGSWSAENDDWNINKKITFTYEPQEDSLIYTVSFYKKSGEEWIWDVFYDQTILFGSQLKNQQSAMRHFGYEYWNGSAHINQFEFTFVYTREPIYLEIEEKGSMICTLHPNPTNGLVTITGKDLKQAEVFNTLGQRVATANEQGEQLSVDISNLPAGVYFVNITDKNGRKCVRKVVKE